MIHEGQTWEMRMSTVEDVAADDMMDAREEFPPFDFAEEEEMVLERSLETVWEVK